MSTAPGTVFTMAITESAMPPSTRASVPRSSSWICLRAPPNPLVNTKTLAPPIVAISRRRIWPNSAWLTLRLFFICIWTYTLPRSAAPTAPPATWPALFPPTVVNVYAVRSA